MATLEEEIKQKKFANERMKANINILFTANWLQNKMSPHFKKFNITHEQFNVLRILRGSHPTVMCQKDVLERMIAPKSNVTLLMQKLKAKKLVSIERSEADSRHYQISITPQGLDLLEQMDAQLKPQQKLLSNLTEAEATQLNLLLNKLRG
jgi:DNA-binding MarR family transcriptional regulator